MPLLTSNAVSRSLLFVQFSAHPWNLSAKVTLPEMQTFAASTSFDELLHHLAHGETQQGAPPNSIKNPIVIGWGSYDRVCFPDRAKRAIERFPDAQLHWFEDCVHFPQWDVPQEAIRLILATTSRTHKVAAIDDSESF